MIKLKKVSKEYKIRKDKGFFALKNINLEIKKGEFASIVGPSGSGKSTLMHIIGLLDKPTSGKVLLNGNDTSSLTDDELSKLRNEFVGFVFQQFNLLNKLTVLENIVLPTVYSNKKSKQKPEKQALYLLERFDMKEKANSYPNKISGGQQQRVAIARALINNPQIILADEPTGNIDTKTGEKILDLLEELNQKDGITLVAVTHDRNIAKRAKRQIKIKDGMI